MPWISGSPVVDPAAGQQLVAKRFTSPEQVEVTVVVMAKYGMDLIFRHVDAKGTTVKAMMILPVTVGVKDFPKLGPIGVDTNETLEVINRNSIPEVTGEEVQAHMFLSR